MIFYKLIWKAGPKKNIGELSSQEFVNYEIKVTNTNYDTNLKVMWGRGIYL